MLPASFVVSAVYREVAAMRPRVVCWRVSYREVAATRPALFVATGCLSRGSRYAARVVCWRALPIER